MPDTTSRRPLTELNYAIEQAEADAARLESEQTALAKDVRRAERRLQYLQLARRLRRPTDSFEMWPILLLGGGAGAFGVLLFMITHFISGSLSIALLALLVGAIGGASLFGSLLYRPADALLEPAIADAEAKRRLEHARLTEKTQRLTEVNDRLQQLIDERRDQIASGKLQRAALLQRNWKSMRGAEWEDYLVEVFRTHGATVQRTGRLAGEDANLVVEHGPRRIAIFTEAEGHNVPSAAIRQALAAKDRHRCDACAVIINRRFTGAAQHFAERNGCTAIGAAEFPDFVLGKIEL